MQDKNIPVTYVLYPDEGHGFARPENNLSFFAVTEAFLAECLGGRHEPMGSDFEGSSITVPKGAEIYPRSKGSNRIVTFEDVAGTSGTGCRRRNLEGDVG